jgi:hypothetical protein
MKAARFLILMMLVIPKGVIAQCDGSLQELSYDTVVTGAGNSLHTFRFPKFNSATGTLVEIRITSEVTLSYNFQIENVEPSSIPSSRVRVGRDDETTSDALITPFINSYQKTYGPFYLEASDGIAGSGPDFHDEPENYVMDHSTIQRIVYNTADYLGNGQVEFQYTASSYSTVLGGITQQFTGSARDTVKFSIVYIICPTWFLASDISFFSAKKKDDQSIHINWMTNNESEDRNYILERSTDGKNFQYVEKFKAITKGNQTSNYQYQYKPTTSEKGKIIFRLKQVEKNGSIKYSPLRIVELSKKQVAIRLFPNPGNGQVNILFHNQKRSDWIVEITSLTGQLLEQYHFKNALLAKIDLRNKLSKGTYIVTTIHKRSEERSVQKFIIR